MKTKEKGFTIVELLTVLATIVLLIGLLVPSVALVRKMAKETRQKAQFITIDQALMAFRVGYGDYPPSEGFDPLGVPYCGAQKLAEALVGWDLLGFHPDSPFLSAGDVIDGGFYDGDESDDLTNLDQRVGPYLDVATANAFTVGQLYVGEPMLMLAPGTFVLCDSFSVKTVPLGNSGKTVKAGTPILYYRANTATKTMVDGGPDDRIYSSADNQALTILPSLRSDGRAHPLDETLFYSEDYKIIDPRVTATKWPYRADSYILISAGADGLYGTDDDITNFGN